jgi:hypothetical protein
MARCQVQDGVVREERHVTADPVTLPTWDECAKAVDGGYATHLQTFIYHEEPADTGLEGFRTESEFRTRLANVIAYERQQQVETAAKLCPHGLPLAENICGPCSEGRPMRAIAGPYCPDTGLPCDRMCLSICNRRAEKTSRDGLCREGFSPPDKLCGLPAGHRGPCSFTGTRPALQPCTCTSTVQVVTCNKKCDGPNLKPAEHQDIAIADDDGDDL